MSSLTIALASLGGVVLAGLVAHGAWQARKAGPKRAAVLPADIDRREEPVMDGAAAIDGDAAAEPAALVPERRAGKRVVNRLDALIDSIATLTLEAPIGGAFAMSTCPRRAVRAASRS